MAAPTLVVTTPLRHAPVAATGVSFAFVQAGLTLAQAGRGDLLEGRPGEARAAWRPIRELIDLRLDGWKDRCRPRLKILALRPASGAIMVASDLDTFSEINIPYRSHPAVRKEGV